MASVAELVTDYLDGAKQLRAAAGGLTPQQATERPIPGKWSVLEVVCHLADFEPIYVDRMKRIIALERPLLIGADEVLFAKNLAYHHRDLEEELATIDLARRGFARVLRSLPETVLQRTGVHNERGMTTLEEMLVLCNKHLRHHTAFVVEKRRALGLAG